MNIFFASLIAILYPFLIWCLKWLSEKANYVISKETYIEQNKKLRKEKREREAELKTIDESLKDLSGEKRVDKIKTLEGKIKEAEDARAEDIAKIETENRALFTSKNKLLNDIIGIRYYLLKEETLDVKAVLNIGRGMEFHSDAIVEKAIDSIMKGETGLTLTQFLFVTLDESIFMEALRIRLDSRLLQASTDTFVNVKKIGNLTDEEIKEYFEKEIEFFARKMRIMRNKDLKAMKDRVSSNYQYISNIMINENASEKDRFNPFNVIMFFVTGTGGCNKAGNLVIEYIENHLKNKEK